MEQLPNGNRFATRDDLGDLENSIRVEFGRRFDLVDERFERVDARFERVDERFDKVDARFDRIDEPFDRINARFDQIHLAMHGYVRTFVIAQVTSIFGAVGLFFGINQLL